MKISEALKTPAEPSLEERVESLESESARKRAAVLSAIGTLCYGDPEFAAVLTSHIADAVKARYEDDAADIGG